MSARLLTGLACVVLIGSGLSAQNRPLVSPAATPLAQASPDMRSEDLVQACTPEVRAYYARLVVRQFRLTALQTQEPPQLAALTARTTGSVEGDARQFVAWQLTTMRSGGAELTREVDGSAARIANGTSPLAEQDQFIVCVGRRRLAQLASGLVPPPGAGPVSTDSSDGIWNITMACPSGSALREPGALVIGGTYSRFWHDARGRSGSTALHMSIAASGELQLSGRVLFTPGQAMPTFVEAKATREGAAYVGTGTFGVDTGCTLNVTPVDGPR